MQIVPIIHCFGHIHEDGLSTKYIAGTTYINCAIRDENYLPFDGIMRCVVENKKVLSCGVVNYDDDDFNS